MPGIVAFLVGGFGRIPIWGIGQIVVTSALLVPSMAKWFNPTEGVAIIVPVPDIYLSRSAMQTQMSSEENTTALLKLVFVLIFDLFS